MISKTIGFIGAGQMARALARGFVAAGLARESQMVAYDPSTSAAETFLGAVSGARIALSNAEVARSCDVVLIAVKPASFAAAASAAKSEMRPDKLIISIAAGIPLASIETALGHRRVVRVMPNTPCLVAQGAAAFALGAGAEEADGQLVQTLFGALGLAVRVDERLLDAVTGLSGSGPAFVFIMIEALADGGVRMGLSREIALKLAAQTVRGAAEMVLASGDHPAVLKDRVASPGGTTIAGLQALEDGGVRSALIRAVELATLRAHELGKGQV